MEPEYPVAALAAMGQETRYAALRLLVDAGTAGIGAGDLARRLDVAPSNLSFHMAALAQAGLTASERQGQSIIHRTAPDALDRLMTVLRQDLLPGRRS